MSTSLLPAIQTELNRYGLSLIYIFGMIGNSFIIILYSKHQQKPCFIYLLWSSVINNIYLTFAIPPTLYTLTYGDLNSRSLIYCKLRYYLTNTLGSTARYFIILACIDRFLSTTINVRFRIFTRPSTARYLTLALFIFWHIFPIHIPLLTTITNGRCNQFGIYYIILYIYIIIFVCFVPIILMSIFGYLTYRNMKNLHQRIQPINASIVNHPEYIPVRNRDRELFKMILAEIFVYIITISLYPITLLEISITTYMGITKTTDFTRIENFIMTIATLLFYVNIGSRFYIFYSISKIFRRDFKKFLKTLWMRITRQNEITLNERVNQT